MGAYVTWIMIVMYAVGLIMRLFDVDGIKNNHLKFSSKIGGLLIGGASLLSVIYLGFFNS